MSTRYPNRETSLLGFQDRLLTMAEDDSSPLLEGVDYADAFLRVGPAARARVGRA